MANVETARFEHERPFVAWPRGLRVALHDLKKDRGSLLAVALSRFARAIEPFRRSQREQVGLLPRVIPQRAVVVAGLLILVLTGCGPFVDPYNLQDHADQPAGLLGGGRTVAQDFVAHANGLSQIDVQVAIYPTIPRTSGSLRVSLWAIDNAHRPDGQSTWSAPTESPIVVATFAESRLAANQWISVSFPPIWDSKGRSFRIKAETTDAATSPATLWASTHVVDPRRPRYANGERVSGTLVYRAFHDQSPGDVGAETMTTVARSGWLWPVALLLCVVPGLGMTSLVSREEEDPAAYLGLAVGWSVLLAPVALVLATPLHFGPMMGLLLLIVGALLVLRRRPRWRPSPWSAVALAAATVALGIRAIDAKGLVAPMWGDPVQHSYVAELILEAGGVPTTYGALMPFQTFDYHFGFQTIAAFASRLVGSEPSEAILATGQILDALICLAIYRFAVDLLGSRPAGAIAAVLVAMVMTQPAYFVTWGRYPEVAALAALPAAYAALRRAIAGQEPRKSPSDPRRVGARSSIDFVSATIAAAALVLVHPRVGVFLASLGVASVVGDAVDNRSVLLARMQLTRLAAVGAASVIALAPWAARLWAAHQHQVVAKFAWQPVDFPLGLAIAGNDRLILELAVVGWIVSLLWRPSVSVMFAVWSALVFVAANPATFLIPVNLYVNNGSVAIALFVPASLLVGHLFATICDRLSVDTWRRGFHWAVAAIILLGGLTQAPSLTRIVNPCCLLIRPGDLGAIAWVRDNTPEDARFLINGYRWMDSVWMGSDAGYWLPVLARRRTTLPPLFYSVGPPSEVEEVNGLAAAVNDSANDPAALAALARRIGARYVFIGSRGGDLDPLLLEESGRFKTDYADGGAWVLEVVPTDPTPSNSTVTGTTPDARGAPRSWKAAGLRSRTSG